MLRRFLPSTVRTSGSILWIGSLVLAAGCDGTSTPSNPVTAHATATPVSAGASPTASATTTAGSPGPSAAPSAKASAVATATARATASPAPTPTPVATPTAMNFALFSDDGSAVAGSGTKGSGVQAVPFTDSVGNAVSGTTPQLYTSTNFDIDGVSLSPDGSHGTFVNDDNVFFFSGLGQGNFVMNPTPLALISNGGDGDALAMLPSGDEIVVTPDAGGSLIVVSGILSGNPVVADTIPPSSVPGFRSGLAISQDGKTLLSRGDSGLDVYNVTPTAAHVGSTGAGTTSYSFSLVASFLSSGTPAMSGPTFPDGREGMAVSPADSSRALIAGIDKSGNPIVQLLTGLTSGSPALQSFGVRVPNVVRRIGAVVEHPEPSAHRSPFSVTPSAGKTLYGTAISEDGSTGYVSTDAGIITIGGVASGSLAQIGAPYSPNLPIPGSTSTCPFQSAATMAVTPNGKYLVAVVDCTGILPAGSTQATAGSGVLVTIPIQGDGTLGAPAGLTYNVVTPPADQMIVH